jgi:hypothetical protein
VRVRVRARAFVHACVLEAAAYMAAHGPRSHHPADVRHAQLGAPVAKVVQRHAPIMQVGVGLEGDDVGDALGVERRDVFC